MQDGEKVEDRKEATERVGRAASGGKAELKPAEMMREKSKEGYKKRRRSRGFNSR